MDVDEIKSGGGNPAKKWEVSEKKGGGTTKRYRGEMVCWGGWVGHKGSN